MSEQSGVTNLEIAPLPETERRHVLVIGAGLVGLASALWLQKAGHRITVIDRQPPLAGASYEQACSYGNACTIAPHSVVPVATPGIAWRVPGMLANPLGPLAIVWRYLPHLAPWLRAFVASSRKDEVERIAAVLSGLLIQADAGWQPLVHEAGAKALERRHGCLYLYKTEAQFQAAEPEMLLRERHDVAWSGWMPRQSAISSPILHHYTLAAYCSAMPIRFRARSCWPSRLPWSSASAAAPLSAATPAGWR
jgi:D-amino-acid dehydrogenase